MILLIDNYDSFTWNLFHYLGELGADVVVHRNDKIATADVVASEPDAIVLSPGPCTPDDAGICLDLIATASATIPMLGVCLGHQAMGQAFGGSVVRAPVPVHGKLSEIKHEGGGVFRGINAPFKATRYHSLVVDRAKMPDDLAVTAETDEMDIFNAEGGGNSSDDIYDQAVAIVCQDDKVSTSYIQRKLRIGYNRAADIIDRMEKEGVITAPNHVGKREVLARRTEKEYS